MTVLVSSHPPKAPGHPPVQLDPSYDWAIANRGLVYRAMERYDDALTDLNRAIELNPSLVGKVGKHQSEPPS
jgi:tetratricopeptide (TPR) repeat protein